MFKRYLISMLSSTVSASIMEHTNGIEDPARRQQSISVLRELKVWLGGSSNKTKRLIAELIPF